MPYNVSYETESRQDIARKILYVLNGMQNNAIAFDKNDLKYMVGGAYFKPMYDFVSSEALAVVRELAPEQVVGSAVRFAHAKHIRGLRIEHAVPVSLFVDHLVELNRDGLLSEQTCIDALERFAKICLITEGEDRRLTEVNLRTRMPEGWTWGNGNAFARYGAVRICPANNI